jgi:hypothetical protein
VAIVAPYRRATRSAAPPGRPSGSRAAPPHLPPGRADHAQQAELARALVHGQRERVRDAHHRDDRREREQRVEEGDDLVDLADRGVDELLVGPRLEGREVAAQQLLDPAARGGRVAGDVEEHDPDAAPAEGLAHHLLVEGDRAEERAAVVVDPAHPELQAARRRRRRAARRAGSTAGPRR